MDSLDLASDLADRIISKRRLDIYDDFFEDVSRTTWDKYFKDRRVGKKNKPPYLTEGLHGFSYVRREDGTVHYRMIAKRRWIRVKRGKVTIPNPKGLEYETKLANKLIDLNDRTEIVKRGTTKGYEVKLAYEKTVPSEYKKNYKATNEDLESETGIGDLKITSTGSKLSKLDKDIFKCISDWAKSNGLKIVVSSDYIG